MGCLLPSLVKLPVISHPQQEITKHVIPTTSLQLSASCYEFGNWDNSPTMLHTFAYILPQQHPALAFFFQFLTLLGDCGSSKAEQEFHRENSCCGLGRVFPNLVFLQKHSRAHRTYSPLPFPCSRMEKGIGGTKGRDHKLRARSKNNYIVILQLIAYKVQSYFNIKHHHTRTQDNVTTLKY